MSYLLQKLVNTIPNCHYLLISLISCICKFIVDNDQCSSCMVSWIQWTLVQYTMYRFCQGQTTLDKFCPFWNIYSKRILHKMEIWHFKRRLYCLRICLQVMHQTAWYNSSSMITAIAWSVSSSEFVSWSKRAITGKQMYQTWQKFILLTTFIWKYLW